MIPSRSGFVHVLVVASLMVASLLLVNDSRAQDAGGVSWRASASTTYHHLSDDRGAWRSLRTAVTRQAPGLSVVAEATRSTRFDHTDNLARLSVWPDLWEGAYGVVQVEASPDPAFSPMGGLFVEVYQDVGSGWEVSGGYRLRRYPGEFIHTYAGSVGAYVGNWYLRAATTLAPRADELGISESLMARRYLNTADTYVQAAGGFGRGIEVVSVLEDEPQIVVTQSYEASLGLHAFLSDHLGLSVTGMYGDTGFFQYAGASAGVLARW